MYGPKVSIVVPIYNVERYLRKCVDSLLAQSLADIEILLVDDGSPDDSGRIADEYAHNESRVKVFHQKNAGLGPARNTGILHASGEYVGFVDSDDWVEPDMYRRLYDASEKAGADICFSGMCRCANGSVIERNVNPFAGQTLANEEEIFKLRRSFYGPLPLRIKEDPLPVSVWTAIYRRNFLEEKDIFFENIRSEDKFFNTIACRASSTVTVIGDTDYNYRCENQSSITRTFSDSMVESYLELFHGLWTLALSEETVYRDECLLRAKRGITDYVRVAMQVIEASSATKARKKEAISRLMNDETVIQASRKYPFRKLPLPQAVFGQALRLRNVTLLRLLAKLGSRI